MPKIDTHLNYRVERTRCDCHPGLCRCPRFSILQENQVIAQGNDLAAIETLVNAARSGVAPRYTIEEQLPDGSWRRQPLAHLWVRREEARIERAKIAECFPPSRKFVVTPVYGAIGDLS